MKVMGDLNVKRTMTAEVRADRGLRVATITPSTPEALDLNAYSWQKLTAAAPETVVMPDATTLPIAGWQVVIEAITSDITVTDFDNTVLKVVPAGQAYQFTCQDIGSTAGVWHFYTLEDFGAIAATRFKKDFNATSDWAGPSAGKYTITVTAATHLRGVNPSVLVSETVGGVEERVEVDIAYDDSTGDVRITVPQHPDCRFAGRALFV